MKTWRLGTTILLMLLLSLTAFLAPLSAADPGTPSPSPEGDPEDGTLIDWANVDMSQFGAEAEAAFSSKSIKVPDEVVLPPTDPVTEIRPNDTTHVVKGGETLSELARVYGIPVSTLITLNNITNPSLIYVGQVLRIESGEVALPEPPAESSLTVNSDNYTVQPGDTLSDIARRFAISVQALAGANNISNFNMIRVGQVLVMAEATVPTPSPARSPQPPPQPTSSSGRLYYVRLGDTLSLIAQRYGIDVRSLAAANNITNASLIYVGQRLLIPDDVVYSPPEQPSGASMFIWPVESRNIVNRYRYGHEAIDIVTQIGAPVVASGSGEVEFAGWNNYGFGWLVVVNHGDNMRSVYAHNDALEVITGQQVKQGERLAASGNTGNSTMPHIHFGIIIDLRAVDPCLYLPGGC